MPNDKLYNEPFFYDDVLWQFSADLPTYEAILNNAQPASILEIGVGTGRILRCEALKGKVFMGIDTEEKMVSRCIERFHKLNDASFYCSTIHNFKPNNSIDCCILGNSVLKHFSEPDIERIGFDISKLLAANGIVIVDHADFLYYHDETKDFQSFEGTVDWFWPKSFRTNLKEYQWKKTIEVDQEILHIKRATQEKNYSETAFH